MNSRVVHMRGIAIAKGKSDQQFEPSSVCLAAMVQEFMESSDQAATNDEMGADLNPRRLDHPCLVEVIQCLAVPESTAAASLARQVFALNESSSQNRADVVIGGLRSLGYIAGLCRCKWEQSSGGIPAGDYEYMDVITESGVRLIIDLEFRSQFEIARPSSYYTSVLEQLPTVFVGSRERLERMVEVMSEAAKESFRSNGLHVPPWRKPTYLKAKWFSTDFTRLDSSTSSSNQVQLGSTSTGSHREPPKMLYTCNQPLTMNTKHDLPPNHCPKLVKCGRLQQGEELAVVISRDWELPAVNPRTSSRPLKGAGLAAVFMRSSLAIRAL